MGRVKAKRGPRRRPLQAGADLLEEDPPGLVLDLLEGRPASRDLPPATPAPSPRDLARAARRLERDRQQLHELVAAAREAGLSWPAIGSALGIAPNAARMRWQRRSW